MERFINSIASQGINIIRNEILYLYEHFSAEIHDLEDSGWDGDWNNYILKEEAQLKDFPSLIGDISFIEARKGERNVFLNGEYLPLSPDIYNGKTVSYFYINNFSGYMAFPFGQVRSLDSFGYVFLPINILPAVDSFLVDNLLTELLSNSSPSRNDNISDYTISIKKGSEVTKNDKEEDLILDLNRSFNLLKVRDYYYIRPDSFQSLPDSQIITDNHLYLTISHQAGSLSAYFLTKRIWIFGGIGLLYILLVLTLLFFLYSTYKTRDSYQREQHFTSLISHELKTPLSVIQLAADNLSGGYLTEMDDVAEYGTMIKEETGRLGRMIENILLISTLSWEGEGGGEFFLDEILEELKKKNCSILKNHEVNLEIINNYEKETLQIRGTLLIAALQNLIHNGIVYGANFSKDRKVILRIESQDKGRRQGILFSVIDHGPGIRWSESQKIFDSYFRGHDATEQQLPGSGMGLSLSRRITRGLGGSLQLNRSLRQGTVFELWIPNRTENE